MYFNAAKDRRDRELGLSSLYQMYGTMAAISGAFSKEGQKDVNKMKDKFMSLIYKVKTGVMQGGLASKVSNFIRDNSKK